MAISKLQPVVTSSINASSITATSPNTMYEGRTTLESGIYTITCINSTVAKVEFYSGTATLITTAVTISGTVTINLATTADRIRLWTDTGSNVVVTITKTANAMSNQFSGTLDTVTTVGSSTYTATSTSGYAYTILIGGGAGGGGGGKGNTPSGHRSSGGGGGGSGAICEKLVQLTGSMTVVIGAGGAGGAGSTNNTLPGANGTAGGNSTFAGMTAGGGNAGPGGLSTNSTFFPATVSGGSGGTATGGTYNTAGPGGNGSTSPNQDTSQGGSGNLSGIPNYVFVTPSITNDYGKGGRGGNGTNGANGDNGTAGNQGVLYVLRF